LRMLNQDQWLVSGQVMPRSDVPTVTPLWSSFLTIPKNTRKR
jgi:hypothetical protein